MSVWIALIAVFIVLIPALLVARAKANASSVRQGDGSGYIATDYGSSSKSKSDNDDSGDGASDGGDGGGGGGD